jgi:hypothetical protein
MCDVTVKKVGCLLLILSQLGCRSVYRFECTSKPSGAGVLVGQEMMGETECTVKIPRNSDLIQDGMIEFTFCLPDGRERSTAVSLRGLKPSNPVAEVVAAPFLLGGAALFVLTTNAKGRAKDSDPARQANEEEKRRSDNLLIGLAGLGIMVIGSGLYHLFGGRGDSLQGRPVHVDFDKPESAAGQPPL